MKVLFVRHGESVDDIDNRYGGWADFPLTEKGKQQIRDKLEAIENTGIKYKRVLTSPLKRARESAQIISSRLDLPLEVFEYVKERNTYGILSGMEKEEARKKYPQQVTSYKENQFVDGSERYHDFTRRVKRSVDLLKQKDLEALIVVTHGKYLKCLFREILGRNLTRKDDGGLALVEFSDDTPQIVLTDGIEYD